MECECLFNISYEKHCSEDLYFWLYWCVSFHLVGGPLLCRDQTKNLYKRHIFSYLNFRDQNNLLLRASSYMTNFILRYQQHAYATTSLTWWSSVCNVHSLKIVPSVTRVDTHLLNDWIILEKRFIISLLVLIPRRGYTRMIWFQHPMSLMLYLATVELSHVVGCSQLDHVWTVEVSCVSCHHRIPVVSVSFQ